MRARLSRLMCFFFASSTLRKEVETFMRRASEPSETLGLSFFW
jgi:hypothetical protein